MRSPRVLVLLLALAVAGCADPTPTAQETPSGPVSYSPPGFSDTTGGIDGMVLGDDLAPIQNVSVAITPGDQVAFTDESGRFSFGDLVPGTYVLQAQRLGYDAAARRVDVAAGEILELRIQLTPLAIEEPYTRTQVLAGKTSCTVSLRTPANYLRPSCSLASAAFPNDRWNHQYPLEAGFRDLLVETIWRPTYSYGNQLFQIVGIEPFTLNTGRLREVEGPSPIRILANFTEFEKWDREKGTSYATKGGPLSLSTFAAHNLVAKPSPVEVGMVIDQSFTVFSTVSYNGPLPSGFTMVPDG